MGDRFIKGIVKRSGLAVPGGDRGQAVVLVIGVIVVFLIFFFVLIDFARMYHIRGQLQNAADAAALAGASRLGNPKDIVQLSARQETWRLACENVAAGRRVFLVNSGSNCGSPPANLNQANNANGDIVLGNWNGAAFTAGGLPVNAVLARAKFTSDAPYNGGEAPLIFGFLIGNRTMGVVRVAIAHRPARGEAPLALCLESCNPGLMLPGIFFAAPTSKEREKQGAFGIAWTVFTDKSPPTSQLVDFICERKVGGECQGEIRSTQGVKTDAGHELRGAFINPKYDSDHKTCTGGTTPRCGDEVSDVVAQWKLITPIVDECPPGDQPDLYTVVRWAEVTITEVAAKGGSFGMKLCSCPPEDNCSYKPLDTKSLGDEYEKFPLAIRITQIRCEDCDPPPEFLSRKPILVH